MTVATLNPFDLLNEDAVPKTAVKKTVVEAKPVAAAKEVKPVATTKDTAKPTNNRNSKNNTTEINANVSEKTPLRRNNNNRRSNPTEGNERQERRRTDRHSRTGYKQDGEKRLTSGKGSWGKAVEQGEEGVTVDESVAIAEAVEGIEISAEAGEAAENAEPTVAHLTLAQYQASLKKPVVASTATRKVTTTLAKDQIVKKETEVFVFPEIVKKSNTSSAKKSSSDSVKSAGIDVTKYISVKAVSSVEPRAERTDRPPRTNNADNRRNHEGRRNSSNNNGNKRESYTPKPTKMNLNDDRSFPAVGSR